MFIGEGEVGAKHQDLCAQEGPEAEDDHSRQATVERASLVSMRHGEGKDR